MNKEEMKTIKMLCKTHMGFVIIDGLYVVPPIKIKEIKEYLEGVEGEIPSFLENIRKETLITNNQYLFVIENNRGYPVVVNHLYTDDEDWNNSFNLLKNVMEIIRGF